MTQRMANVVYRAIKEDKIIATKQQIKNMYNTVDMGFYANHYDTSTGGESGFDTDSRIVESIINQNYDAAQMWFNKRF